MTDQELDALIRRALIDSIRLDFLDLEEAAEDEPFVPSARHQRQMRSMLKDPLKWARKRSRPLWKTALRTAAMILLAVSIGFGVMMAASPTARAAFARWITEWYETHITYRYAGESITGAMPRYEITKMPEGYHETARNESLNYTEIIYQNEDSEHQLTLRCVYMQQGAAADIITERLETIPVTVNGMAGELYLSHDLEAMDSTVTWIDEENNLQFVVDAPLAQADILRLAGSVSKEISSR